MGYYESIAARRFFEEDGKYFVLPRGKYGRKRQYEDEASFVDAKEYFINTYRWFQPLAVGCGVAIWKMGLLASPLAVGLAIFYNLITLPRINRGTVAA